MIDLSKLPERVMFDSSVLTRTRDGSTLEHSDLCRELWTELIRHRHHILIPAVAIAEYMEKPPHDRPKRNRSVTVVPFDEDAAEILAKQFPHHVFLRQQAVPGATKAIIKYDTMILASAVRHRAELVFCMDTRLTTLAGKVGMKVMSPLDLPRLMEAAPEQPPAPSGPPLFPDLPPSRAPWARSSADADDDGGAPPKRNVPPRSTT